MALRCLVLAAAAAAVASAERAGSPGGGGSRPRDGGCMQTSWGGKDRRNMGVIVR